MLRLLQVLVWTWEMVPVALCMALQLTSYRLVVVNTADAVAGPTAADAGVLGVRCL